MMQHHGFAAREAMGWLRIVRPGSVIGPQQQYLVERESVMRRTGSWYLTDGPSVAARAAGPAGVARLIAEAVGVVDGRLRALRADRRRRSTESPSPLHGDSEAPTGPLASGSRSDGLACSGDGDASAAGDGEGQARLRYCADLLPLPTVRRVGSAPA